VPAYTAGHSTSAVTSSSSAGSSAQCEAHDHAAALLQRVQITAGAFDAQRSLAEETMPQGTIAAGQPQHFARHDAIAQQHDQAVRRTHELRLAGAPTHHLRRGQLLQRVRHDAGQVQLERLAALDRPEYEELALGVLAARERADLRAAALREAQQGLRWVAVLAQRLRDVGTLALHLPLGLHLQHVRH
jgi:hypothetical protein